MGHILARLQARRLKVFENLCYPQQQPKCCKFKTLIEVFKQTFSLNLTATERWRYGKAQKAKRWYWSSAALTGTIHNSLS